MNKKTIGDRIREIEELSLDFENHPGDRREYSHMLYCAFPTFNIHGDQIQFSKDSDYMSLKEAQEACLEMYQLLFPTRPVVTFNMPENWPTIKPPKGALTEAQTKRLKKAIREQVKVCEKHFKQEAKPWDLDFYHVVGEVFINTFDFHLTDALLFALMKKGMDLKHTPIENRTMITLREDGDEDNN